METKITLKIKTMDNQITPFQIDPNNTIAQLKGVIQNKLNIPHDKQRLIYQGRVLENNKTLTEYKLQNDHVILLPGQPEPPIQQQPQQQQQQIENELQELDILGNILRTLRQHQYNRQNVRRMVMQQRNTGFNLDRQISLESIKQNYQTIQQLLDSQTRTKELKKEDIQGDYINPFDPKKRKFQIGQWIDVKDTIDQWVKSNLLCKLEAQVLSIQDNRIFVHYNGWGNRWDEWLDNQSPRIATFRTYTVGSINQDYLSPHPVSEPDADIEKQEVQMNKFIFDIADMMNQVIQLLIEFGKYENQKILAKRHLNLQRQFDEMTKKMNQNLFNIQQKEQEIQEFEVKSSLVSSQLAPIFDRMGRMMTDLSPHLALIGSKTQKVVNNNVSQYLFQVPVTLTPQEINQSQQNAPTLHSRLEIVSNRLAILRMTELISQDDSDDEAAQII